MLTETSSREVTARIKDWIDRLNRLYAKLDEWLADIPHDKVERGTIRQIVEPFMRRFGVSPRRIPTYTILKGSARVEFIPTALSVPGTKGRVDITTNIDQHLLVDRDGRWQIEVDNYNRPLVPFTKAHLMRLLAEGE